MAAEGEAVAVGEVSANDALVHHVRHGRGWLESGEPERARLRLEQALELSPDSPSVLHLLGLAYYRLSLFSEAEDVYLRLISLHGDDPVLLVTLGLVRLRQGIFGEAERVLVRALELDSNYERAHLYLGVAAYKRGALTEAMDHFQRGDAPVLAERVREAIEPGTGALDLEGSPLFDLPPMGQPVVMPRSQRGSAAPFSVPLSTPASVPVSSPLSVPLSRPRSGPMLSTAAGYDYASGRLSTVAGPKDEFLSIGPRSFRVTADELVVLPEAMLSAGADAAFAKSNDVETLLTTRHGCTVTLRIRDFPHLAPIEHGLTVRASSFVACAGSALVRQDLIRGLPVLVCGGSGRVLLDVPEQVVTLAVEQATPLVVAADAVLAFSSALKARVSPIAGVSMFAFEGDGEILLRAALDESAIVG